MGRYGMLVKHYHKQAMASWYEYLMCFKSETSIENVMFGVQKKKIDDNRHYLRAVIETILLCAKKNIGLRGHRENEKSLNRSPW